METELRTYVGVLAKQRRLQRCQTDKLDFGPRETPTATLVTPPTARTQTQTPTSKATVRGLLTYMGGVPRTHRTKDTGGRESI